MGEVAFQEIFAALERCPHLRLKETVLVRKIRKKDERTAEDIRSLKKSLETNEDFREWTWNEEEAWGHSDEFFEEYDEVCEGAGVVDDDFDDAEESDSESEDASDDESLSLLSEDSEDNSELLLYKTLSKADKQIWKNYDDEIDKLKRSREEIDQKIEALEEKKRKLLIN
jgi:hypothetical protein